MAACAGISRIIPEIHNRPYLTGEQLAPIRALDLGKSQMSDFSNFIIEMLRASPNGLTTIDIAARLGTTAGNLSSRLSKLAAYGIIGKARRPLGGNGSRGTVYQAPRD